MDRTLQIVCFTAALCATAAPALARERAMDKRGTVTACSTYGRHGCYTAPVRQTPLGAQLRLKGGTWIWCEGDCRDTLRRETIDFWDDQRDRNR